MEKQLAEREHLKQCLDRLADLRNDDYGIEAGVQKFSKDLLKLNNDETYAFADRWLKGLEEAQSDRWSEQDLLRFLYVVHDVMVRFKGRGSHSMAFKKVLKPAMKVLRYGLYSQKSKARRVVEMWKERAIYETDFVALLLKLLDGEDVSEKRRSSMMESNSKRLKVDSADVELQSENGDEEESDVDVDVESYDYNVERKSSKKNLLRRRNSGLSEAVAEPSLEALLKLKQRLVTTKQLLSGRLESAKVLCGSDLSVLSEGNCSFCFIG